VGRFSSTIACTELQPAPSATFAPSTAAAARPADAGELIDLVAGERTLRDLLVRVDRAADEGTVSVIDGLPAAPANAFAEGAAVAVGNLRVPQAAFVGGPSRCSHRQPTFSTPYPGG
jgi:hypothetical protein